VLRFLEEGLREACDEDDTHDAVFEDNWRYIFGI
jgi:hypothetical protein